MFLFKDLKIIVDNIWLSTIVLFWPSTNHNYPLQRYFYRSSS